MKLLRNSKGKTYLKSYSENLVVSLSCYWESITLYSHFKTSTSRPEKRPIAIIKKYLKHRLNTKRAKWQRSSGESSKLATSLLDRYSGGWYAGNSRLCGVWVSGSDPFDYYNFSYSIIRVCICVYLSCYRDVSASTCLLTKFANLYTYLCILYNYMDKVHTNIM